MDWIARMNEVLQRLEENLEDDVDMNALAKLAGVSPYHFQIVFTCMTDMTASEYVRRRRMSRAAAELQSGAKVLDVALKYGYQSPTAFNRAFHQVHGIAPSEARKPGAKLKSYPPIRFQITVKGVEEMKYCIQSMEAFTVAVQKRMFHLDNCFQEIPAFWEAYYDSGRYTPPVQGCYGICHDPCDDSGEFTYMIGDLWPKDAPLPQGYELETIPALTWAIFEGEGYLPEDLQKLNRRVFTEWLPGNSEYQMAAPWNMEVYMMEPGDQGSNRFALWIPVKRKDE